MRIDMPTSNDYKVIASDCAYHIAQLKELRKHNPSEGLRHTIKYKIHTLMVARWIASKHFGMESRKLTAELKRYYRSVHIKDVLELYFLKHYRYGYEDLDKYKEQFKEEVGYEINPI